LVTRQAIERFGDDHIQLAEACVFEKALIGWRKRARATQRAVGVDVAIMPTFLFDPRTTQPHLVLDRSIAL
jgi:hypothetical protein